MHRTFICLRHFLIDSAPLVGITGSSLFFEVLQSILFVLSSLSGERNNYSIFAGRGRGLSGINRPAHEGPQATLISLVVTCPAGRDIWRASLAVLFVPERPLPFSAKNITAISFHT